MINCFAISWSNICSATTSRELSSEKFFRSESVYYWSIWKFPSRECYPERVGMQEDMMIEREEFLCNDVLVEAMQMLQLMTNFSSKKNILKLQLISSITFLIEAVLEIRICLKIFWEF